MRKFAQRGDLDMVTFLVEHGADIHGSNDAPIIMACTNNHLPIVKYLVERGVNKKCQNNALYTIANRFGYRDILQYLQ